MKRSRRRFLGLIAAGSAAAAADPAAALERAAAAKRKPAKPAPPGATDPKDAAVPPAVAAEIRQQKAAVEQSLRALREVPLPPGSETAFVFAPLRPRRRAGAP